MINEELDNVLNEVREWELAQAPKRHYLQTDDCPNLDKLCIGLRNAMRGWSAAEKAHFASCAFCNMTAGMLWQAEPPSVVALLSYAADPANCPFREAMEKYLAEEDSWRVRLALSAGAVIRLIERQRQAPPSEESGPPSLVLDFGLPLAAAGNFAAKSRERLHLRSKNMDGSLISLLEETDEGWLVAHVETPSEEDDGRVVSVEILSRGRTLSAEIKLEKLGFQLGGCHGKHVFGDFSQFEYLQEGCAIVAAWAGEDHPELGQ